MSSDFKIQSVVDEFTKQYFENRVLELQKLWRSSGRVGRMPTESSISGSVLKHHVQKQMELRVRGKK